LPKGAVLDAVGLETVELGLTAVEDETDGTTTQDVDSTPTSNRLTPIDTVRFHIFRYLPNAISY
jgi:hypothetical protein